MNRQLSAVLLAAALVIAPNAYAPVHANESAKQDKAADTLNLASYLKFTLNDVHAELFGQPIVLDTPPQQIGNTTMVPVRVIAEALGAEVNWDDELQLINIVKEMDTIQLVLEQTNASVNGETKELEQPAQRIADLTFVPLRFIAESLHQQVEFDAQEQAIYIRPAEKTTKLPAPSTEGTTSISPMTGAPVPVPAPVPQATPTPSPLKRLSKPKVEKITIDHPSALTKTLDFVVDRDNQLYVLDDGQGGLNSEKVYRIDLATRNVTETISKIDDAFQFTYVQSGKPTEVITFDLAASQLYYDSEQNRVYLLAHNTMYTYEMYMRSSSKQPDTYRDLQDVVYQITPEVRMSAYVRGGTTQNYAGVLQDFLFIAPDGNIYWSDARRAMAYSAAPQSVATPLATMPSSTDLNQMRLNALYANGNIYIFDDKAQRLYKLNPKTRDVSLIYTASFGTILDVEAHRDSFYIFGKDYIYKMGIDGSSEIYVKLDDLLTAFHLKAELQGKLVRTTSWNSLPDDEQFMSAILYAEETDYGKVLIKLDASGNILARVPNGSLYKITLFE
ncbi:MAG: copper amine oxidase protein [Paenibacillus sp.]|jgi:hypothetical protein|nr:copper amine oxidase protein [Paenibacillus sp.]